MNVSEIWTGTKAEKAEVATVNLLSQKTTPLTSKEAARLATARPIIRGLHTRRAVLGATGAGILVLLGIKGAPALGTSSSEPSVSTPDNPMSTILAEAVRLGIKPSADEQKLIAQTPFWTPGNRTVTTEADKQEADARLDTAVTFMQKSLNPKLRQTWNLILPLYSNGDLQFALIDEQTPGFRSDGVFGTSLELSGDKLVFNIKTKRNIILKDTNTLTTALYIAHELEHVRSLSALINSLGPQASNEEKLAAIHAKHEDPLSLLQEEARAFAVESEALIVECGLGYKGPLPDDLLADTLAYIRFGSTNSNPAWLHFINQRHVHNAA